MKVFGEITKNRIGFCINMSNKACNLRKSGVY